MLYCPARSPFSFSSLLFGGIRRSLRSQAASRIWSFLYRAFRQFGGTRRGVKRSGSIQKRSMSESLNFMASDTSVKQKYTPFPGGFKEAGEYLRFLRSKMIPISSVTPNGEKHKHMFVFMINWTNSDVITPGSKAISHRGRFLTTSQKGHSFRHLGTFLSCRHLVTVLR